MTPTVTGKPASTGFGNEDFAAAGRIAGVVRVEAEFRTFRNEVAELVLCGCVWWKVEVR